MSKLLSDRIKDLHLRPNAPYPSEELRNQEEAKDVRDMVKKWRKTQRVHIVTPNYDEERDGE